MYLKRFFIPVGDYYLKIIEKDTLFYERPFELPDWRIERDKKMYAPTPNSKKRKQEPHFFLKNDEEFFKAYKEAGGTVYLNRDRYNEIIKKIEGKLYERFDAMPLRPLHTYNKDLLKKIDPETQEIIEKQWASIIVVNAKDEIIFACDVDARPYLYHENDIWDKYESYEKVLKRLSGINFIKIKGDGTLQYHNNTILGPMLWSSGDIKNFCDFFKKVKVLDSWNNLLGEMDLFLKDDRYPNVKLPPDLNQYVLADATDTVCWPLEVRNR